MFPYRLLWLCLLIALLESVTAGQFFGSQLNATSSLNSSQESADHIVPLLSDIPRPTSNQTIGSYFDRLLGAVSPSKNLRERHLFRDYDKSLLTSSWAHGQGYFNISLDKCMEFRTVAGIYTSRDGTRENATILDINRDLQFRLATTADNDLAIGSRVLDNALRATIEAENYLQTAICGYTIGTNAHEELRHLLAADGYWVALMTKSFIYGSIGTALYAGVLNRNASVEQAIGVAIAASGLAIVDGVISRMQTNGKITFLEATIINSFTAWFRRALRVGSDSEESTCIPEIIVHDALGALPYFDNTNYFLDAITKIELERTCRS